MLADRVCSDWSGARTESPNRASRNAKHDIVFHHGAFGHGKAIFVGQGVRGSLGYFKNLYDPSGVDPFLRPLPGIFGATAALSITG